MKDPRKHPDFSDLTPEQLRRGAEPLNPHDPVREFAQALVLYEAERREAMQKLGKIPALLKGLTKQDVEDLEDLGEARITSRADAALWGVTMELSASLPVLLDIPSLERLTAKEWPADAGRVEYRSLRNTLLKLCDRGLVGLEEWDIQSGTGRIEVTPLAEEVYLYLWKQRGKE